MLANHHGALRLRSRGTPSLRLEAATKISCTYSRCSELQTAPTGASHVTTAKTAQGPVPGLFARTPLSLMKLPPASALGLVEPCAQSHYSHNRSSTHDIPTRPVKQRQLLGLKPCGCTGIGPRLQVVSQPLIRTRWTCGSGSWPLARSQAACRCFLIRVRLEPQRQAQ